MKYLVPYDFTTISQNAVQHALRLCKVSGGNLFLLHIVKNKNDYKDKEKELNSYISGLDIPQGIDVSGHVVVGDIFTDIGKIAEYHGADLVVMGTHGVDALQKIFGSRSVKIITHSVVPFVVVQENSQMQGIHKIVMPVSFESESIQVLRAAAHLSKLFDAEIHLIGRHQEDEFAQTKVNVNIIVAKKFMDENKVKHSFEVVDIPKSEFMDYLLEYSEKNGADLLAASYYTGNTLPIFAKFVQNLIVNTKNIPVLCVNAEALTHISSQYSFITV
ncbi:MAG: universal stress protein UspA-like protein [Crocinitomicaceae bacterium]|jgi:nucleotide-binding universal stress UspA family protein|nr:universal stress protein UspA-like protein [Crocinitomicaceae bacterium]